ncbi:hypothetical protein [Solirubrum puertoriconensis]|uniref:Lipocalin-like domain-containing protein n=1 Tax=Solirubrum puertoriconensis TaxID=1751427 RepID=A0A9X0HP62_SOLP1|nr:hypothetical protein [Solirubrum puertoriconensis]KUG09686.1 hypothetical protein ASU33_18540 [Solirubrum puertoriconensis]
MKASVLARVAAPVLLLTVFGFRAEPPAATNTFSVKVNGKALTGKPGFNTCILMMNALTLGGDMADGSHVMVEIMPASFPTLPTTLPMGVQSVEKFVKVFYYPKGTKDALNYYTSVKGGTLTVTRYDAATRTIAGSFSGKLVRVKGMGEVPSDNLQLTDGRFDVAFTKR